MAFRAFVDYDGTSWHVWEVIPDKTERRARERRRLNLSVEDEERRGVYDRRFSGEHADLPPELVEGWLVFQSSTAKRRFWPIPPSWQTLSQGELVMLCEEAQPAGMIRDEADLAEVDRPDKDSLRA